MAEGELSVEYQNNLTKLNKDYFESWESPQDTPFLPLNSPVERLLPQRATIELINKYFRPDLVERAIATARCESSLNSNAIGDHGTSFGLWQIHLPAHPTVTKEQALDPEWSTRWAAEKFAINPRIWSCYRILYDKNTN